MARQKAIGASGLFALGFGTIIGVGWIIALGMWLSSAGPVGASLAFLGGAALVLIVGLCYAELAGMYPRAGGELVYAEEAFGRTAAFWSGWALVLIYVPVTAFEAVSVGWVSSMLVPAIRGTPIYEVAGQSVHAGELAVGLIVLAVIGWFNALGGRAAAIFQNVATWTIVGLTLVFITAGFNQAEPQHWRPWFGEEQSRPFAATLSILVTTPFWYAGFNVIAQALGERSEQFELRRVATIIAASISAAAVFYILIIVAASSILPRGELVSAEMPAVTAFEAALGSSAWGKLVLVVGLLGLITTWNAVYFAGSRVFYSLARDRLAPMGLAKINHRGAPVIAIWTVGAAAALLTLAGRGVVENIVNVVGIAFAALYLVVALSAVRLRQRKPAAVRPFKVPGGQSLLWFAALLSGALLSYAVYQPATVSRDFPTEWLILVIWLLGGVALRLMMRGNIAAKHSLD